MNKKTRSLTAEVPIEIHEALSQEAEAKQVSMAAIVRWALMERYSEQSLSIPPPEAITALKELAEVYNG
jgi:hypothetical protein